MKNRRTEAAIVLLGLASMAAAFPALAQGRGPCERAVSCKAAPDFFCEDDEDGED